MAQCSYCETTIVFGGVREGELRFCNAKCQASGGLIRLAASLPADVVSTRVNAVHQGNCPQCQRTGPVDIHLSHTIWSALLVTSHGSRTQLSCTPCGRKAKVKATVGCFFLGWWGFPWGVLGTPVQISKNLWGLSRPPSPFVPSSQLEKVVRLDLAAELARAEQAGIPPALGKN